MSKIVIALGGNAIQSANEKGTYEEQRNNIHKTMEKIAELRKAGHEVVLTHGNGPQVGNLLIQHHAGRDQVCALPMFMCGAQTQGQIGYLIQQSLKNILGDTANVATIITQVAVDAKDSSFQNPSKPVGPFYKEKISDDMIEDAGRGFRRVVPSPIPDHIVELDVIKKLIDNDVLVIASGGGGIPVVKKENGYEGVDAVIDKDRAGQLLARELEADIFIVLTDVEKVALNYNTPEQKDLNSLTVDEAKKYIVEGHFAKGSMLPKIEAAIEFLEKGHGEKVIITHPFKILEALSGETGTQIIN
ncbi:MAG: carbamate kinase [Patescibacteria group bacterium]